MTFGMDPFFKKNRFSDWVELIGFSAIFVLLTFLVYHPVSKGDFIWDDEFLVQKNPFIRSPILGLEVFRHFLFENSQGEFYRPIQNLSYIVDYWRAGLASAAFHSTNLLIHGLNGSGFFLLTRKLVRRLTNVSARNTNLAVFFAASFWIVHPVHSAIAAYVSGRADSLALCSFLFGWISWENSVIKHPGKLPDYRPIAWFSLALVLFLIACCSKEIALAANGLFVVYLWFFYNEIDLALKLKTTAGILSVIVLYLFLRHLPDSNPKVQEIALVDWRERGSLFFRCLGDYARLFVYPQKLFMERQVSFPTGLFTDPVQNDALFPFLSWIGGGLIILLTWSCWWKGKGSKLRALGVIWFVILILPVSNLIRLNATVAEHWLYIPSIGLILWCLGCWLDFPIKIQRIFLGCFPLILVLFGSRTWSRAGDWKDARTFYLATIRAGGDSVRMRINLGAEYQKIGNLDESARLYRSILRVMPDYPVAKAALERNLSLQAQAKAGAAGSSRSLVNVPVAPALPLSLSQSEKILREKYLERPGSWPDAGNLVKHLLEEKKIQEARQVAEDFVGRNWWHCDARNSLAELDVMSGRTSEAVGNYRVAASLDIRDPEPLTQAALLLASMGKYREAILSQKRSIARSQTSRQSEILKTIENASSRK